MTESLLEKLIDEGIKENAPNEVIVEILKNYATHYQIRLTGFGIFDPDGNKLVQINTDGTVIGYLPYSFTVPSNSPEDEKLFREFCSFLNRKFDAINYPIIPT